MIIEYCRSAILCFRPVGNVPLSIIFTTRCAGTNTKNQQVALCQIMVGEDKEANIKAAQDAVTKAAKTGAKIIALPGINGC